MDRVVVDNFSLVFSIKFREYAAAYFAHLALQATFAASKFVIDGGSLPLVS
jgi:hypothetical protein